MIVVDSSALVAIVLDEPERLLFTDLIMASERTWMSAVNAYETALVLRSRRNASAVGLLWTLFDTLQIEIAPFDDAQALAAAAAYDRYGKGIDARASLNLADCAAYALARSLDVPLLFKGRDFMATDIRPCV